MQEKTDRRIRRTDRTLAQALIELTSEHPYASIQVRDIADRADIGYATFYRHYKSKDDLMLSIFDEITEKMECSAADPQDHSYGQEGASLFSYIQTYPGFFRSIVQNGDFTKKLKKLLAKRIEQQIQCYGEAIQSPAFPLDLAAHHMVVSLIGAIEWWLDNKMKLTPAEMGLVYDRLIIQATWYALDPGNRLASPCAKEG